MLLARPAAGWRGAGTRGRGAARQQHAQQLPQDALNASISGVGAAAPARRPPCRLLSPLAAPAASNSAGASARRAPGACAALAPFRGLAVRERGGRFEPMDYDPPPLGPSDLEIAVTHGGLCGSDLHMRDDEWGITSYPLIAGHEIVGTVAAKGDAVTAFEVGDRVGYGWLRGSCRACAACLRGEENLCPQQEATIVGPGHYGGFQPRARLPSAFAYRLPEEIPSAEAAPLLCAGVTVYAPLRRHLKRPGAAVAVLGVGGLGHLAVQFAAAMGADVTALVMTDGEAAAALSLGAAAAAPSQVAFGNLKGRFDLVLNCASASIPADKILGLLRAGGAMVQLGIPGSGAKISLPLQDLVFGQKACAGSLVGSRANMQEMLAFAASSGVRPRVELFKLSQINEAAARAASGAARYRVVMEVDEI